MKSGNTENNRHQNVCNSVSAYANFTGNMTLEASNSTGHLRTQLQGAQNNSEI